MNYKLQESKKIFLTHFQPGNYLSESKVLQYFQICCFAAYYHMSEVIHPMEVTHNSWCTETLFIASLQVITKAAQMKINIV